MADYINIIERALIDSLRTDFPEAHVYGQYPDAVNLEYPAIILELVGMGQETKFMGEGMTFGTTGKGEIYGVIYRLHLIVNAESMPTSGNASGFKQRRLLNYYMLNVANTITDISFNENDVEIVERHLRAWEDVGWVPELEVWGASASYICYFKNYRSN